MKAYIVDRNDLLHNLTTLVGLAQGTPIYAVLKGNGYGLGLVPMAQACRDAGIDRFAVTEVFAVRALRDAGFVTQEILMLRPTCDEAELRELIALNTVLTVSSQDDATVLNGVAGKMDAMVCAHLKIDTGMGRYGFLPDQLDQITPVFTYMERIAVTGIYSHFSCAFCDKKRTQAQYETFQNVLKALHDKGFETGTAHICNSSAFLRQPEMKLDAVRLGSSLLGRLAIRGDWGLKRIGRCEAGVEELRWLPKGASCGYGSAWVARKPTRVAVLAVGWYHGFGCEMGNDIFRFRDGLRMVLRGLRTMLSRKAIYVELNGKRCRVLGHIGMLHTVIDVTNVNCQLGDTAVLNINPTMLKGLEVRYV